MTNTLSKAKRPQFIEDLARAYQAGLSRCIIVSGNIYDIFPFSKNGDVAFVSLERLLRETLRNARSLKEGKEEPFIILVLRSDGIHFVSADDRSELERLAHTLTEQTPSKTVRSREGKGEAGAWIYGENLKNLVAELVKERTSSLAALTIFGELLKLAAKIRKAGVRVRPLGIIIDHADALLPQGDMPRLSGLDREVLKYFLDLLRDEDIWADATTADERPDVVLLLSPTVAEVNQRLLHLPKTVHISVPTPDEEARQLFVSAALAKFPVTFDYDKTLFATAEFVKDSRGLTLRALDDLVTAAYRTGSPINRSVVVEKVNARLRAQLGNIINIMYPDHGMDAVRGSRKLKTRLKHFSESIDDPELAPAGIVMVGPNGAGKTFIVEAWAKETGRTIVTLKDIRSMWYGQTDAFAEMFDAAVSSFGRIIIFIDEAHVELGSIHSDQTHEVEARLAGHFLQMMDNEQYRSRILWVLATTRPDKLDPDVVRRGRCSLFVPVFDPEGEDAEDFLNWMIKRFADKGILFSDGDSAALKEKTKEFSAGDYRDFISAFIDEKRFQADVTVAQFLDNWTPSNVSIGKERELQINLAALRCDWRELLPERLHGKSREEIAVAIDLFKLRLTL